LFLNRKRREDMFYLTAIKHSYIKAVKAAFDIQLNDSDVLINETRKEFDGDYTFVIFPLVKTLGKSPEAIGNTIGDWLVSNDISFGQKPLRIYPLFRIMEFLHQMAKK
jgi:arginyl-tRNA synthetase